MKNRAALILAIVKNKPFKIIIWVVLSLAVLVAFFMPSKYEDMHESSRPHNDLSNLKQIYKSAASWGLQTPGRAPFPPSYEILKEETKRYPSDVKLFSSETGKTIEYYPVDNENDGALILLVSQGKRGRNFITGSGGGGFVQDGTPGAVNFDDEIEKRRNSVNRIILHTDINQEGRTVNTCSYVINKTTEQYLKIILPKGANLQLVQYVGGNGQRIPVKPATEDEGITVPIFPQKDINTPLQVELSYTITMMYERLGLFQSCLKLEPPRALNIPMPYIHWTIAFPNGFYQAVVKSNFSTSDIREVNPLSLIGQCVYDFYHTLAFDVTRWFIYLLIGLLIIGLSAYLVARTTYGLLFTIIAGVLYFVSGIILFKSSDATGIILEPLKYSFKAFLDTRPLQVFSHSINLTGIIPLSVNITLVPFLLSQEGLLLTMIPILLIVACLMWRAWRSSGWSWIILFLGLGLGLLMTNFDQIENLVLLMLQCAILAPLLFGISLILCKRLKVAWYWVVFGWSLCLLLLRGLPFGCFLSINMFYLSLLGLLFDDFFILTTAILLILTGIWLIFRHWSKSRLNLVICLITVCLLLLAAYSFIMVRFVFSILLILTLYLLVALFVAEYFYHIGLKKKQNVIHDKI